MKADRIKRRQYLLDRLDHIVSESSYHREHEDAEQLPYYDLWQWDEEVGASDRISDDSTRGIKLH